MAAIAIRVDDMSGPAIQALIGTHLAHSAAHTAPESIHALDLDGLRSSDITLWSAWKGATLVAMGGLKELSPEHGELKSMHTAEAPRGNGYGEVMLLHIIGEAHRRGYRRLSLETGAQAAYAASRALYAKHGFEFSGPFAQYVGDSSSMFMTLAL
jgi:putative acetyltransferase